MKINSIIGPWVSLGIHIDFKHKHIDIHFIWWVIIIGNTIEPIHCGYCNADIEENVLRCPNCGVFFGEWVNRLTQNNVVNKGDINE